MDACLYKMLDRRTQQPASADADTRKKRKNRGMYRSITNTNTYIIHSFDSLYVQGEHLSPAKTCSEPMFTSSPSDLNPGWLTNAFIPSTGVHLLQLEQAGHKTNMHQAWLVAAQIDKVFPSVKSSLMTESFNHQTFRVKTLQMLPFSHFCYDRKKQRKESNFVNNKRPCSAK